MIIFNISDYQFVTMDESGEVGSIYFPNGRIRLLHSTAPEVEAGRTEVVQQIKYQKRFFSAVPVALFARDITKANALEMAKAYLQMAKEAGTNTVAMEGEIQKLDRLIKTEGVAPDLILSTLTVIAKYAALGCQLFETFKAKGKAMRHTSRGIPVKLPLGIHTQKELDDLCDLIISQKAEQFRIAIYNANTACYDYCQEHNIGLFLHHELID